MDQEPIHGVAEADRRVVVSSRATSTCPIPRSPTKQCPLPTCRCASGSSRLCVR